METKFKKSEKLVPEQNISDRERTNKVNDNNNCRLNNQTNGEDGLIPTELPLVYRQDNVLTVENGLNLSRRHELWGIQLLSGTMVALRSGATEDNVSSTAWRKVKEFAEKMTFNGKSGILPSKNALKKHWGDEEKEKFINKVLERINPVYFRPTQLEVIEPDYIRRVREDCPDYDELIKHV